MGLYMIRTAQNKYKFIHCLDWETTDEEADQGVRLSKQDGRIVLNKLTTGM